MVQLTTETFFRPDEIARERLTVPAPLYNRCRLMLARCRYEHVFVPVRAMQMLAVIDEEEVIFVDKEAYAVRDGEGGRMIVLVWQFRHELRGDDLTGPAPIELIYLHEQARELHTRLVGEFAKALDQLEQRYREHGCEPRRKKVLPFPRR